MKKEELKINLKNTATMKTIITLSLLLSALICQAQDNYLTIYKSDSPYDQISL